MKIVLTGGGTAGHVIPHLALLSELKKHFTEIHYIGSYDGMEKEIIESKKIPYNAITTVKLYRSFNPKNLLIPFKLIKGVCQAKKLLKQINPDVIFSKGGFVAVPVCKAGSKLKIPVISHESDFTLGLANKLNYKNSKVMCCSFETTSKYGKKCVHTGSPLREQLLKGSKSRCIQDYKLNPLLPIIVVTGGSLGAVRINQTIAKSKNELLKNFNIIHICGKGKKIEEDIKTHNGKYVQLEFVSNPEDIFSSADIVVCRAGSNTIFEFLALSKPMLLLPLSKAESRGDQILNANEFANKGYAKIILDENLSDSVLIKEINEIYLNRNDYINNLKNSTENNGNKKILSEILKYTKN